MGAIYHPQAVVDACRRIVIVCSNGRPPTGCGVLLSKMRACPGRRRERRVGRLARRRGRAPQRAFVALRFVMSTRATYAASKRRPREAIDQFVVSISVGVLRHFWSFRGKQSIKSNRQAPLFRVPAREQDLNGGKT